MVHNLPSFMRRRTCDLGNSHTHAGSKQSALLFLDIDVSVRFRTSFAASHIYCSFNEVTQGNLSWWGICVMCNVTRNICNTEVALLLDWSRGLYLRTKEIVFSITLFENGRLHCNEMHTPVKPSNAKFTIMIVKRIRCIGSNIKDEVWFYKCTFVLPYTSRWSHNVLIQVVPLLSHVVPLAKFCPHLLITDRTVFSFKRAYTTSDINKSAVELLEGHIWPFPTWVVVRSKTEKEANIEGLTIMPCI